MEHFSDTVAHFRYVHNGGDSQYGPGMLYWDNGDSNKFYVQSIGGESLYVEGEEGTKLVRYGQHMKDLVRNSDYFPQAIRATVVLLIPFEELPEQMRSYIVAKAGFMFQSAYYGDEGMMKITEMQVQDSWQHLMDYEMDNNKYSMLDNDHVKELLSR